MKKIILLALTAVMMVWCGESKAHRSKVVEINSDPIHGNIRIVEIDSCEYIWGALGQTSHKGNCRFCKERRQKELEKLVNKLKEK